MADARREPDADPGRPSDLDFDGFYAAHFRSLTVQLYAYTGDLPTAQDAVQEAFLRALARWPRLAGAGDPLAWVRRVAWNLAISHWRRARTAALFLRRYRVEHVPAPEPDRVAVVGALATLPDRHRRVVVLHYLADLPVRDIAEQIGVPEGTVKVWLHRGRTALAARLADKEDETWRSSTRTR
ncbi:RNA polymerase sigma factor [Actinoplanes sp. CA-030573]|uniref:RNA polymerase sigma factor n=1 Tax=Actinoplanes sp. CA-030573 TaxID=3239898 RepID=UPI003D927553